MSAARRPEKPVQAAAAVLGSEQSAALRERLLASLGQLQSADEAADWVHANLAAKNTLIAADADRVVSDFGDRLAEIEAASAREEDRQSELGAGIEKQCSLASTEDPSCSHDHLALRPGSTIPKYGGEDYSLARQGALQVRSSKPCIVCGRTPCEAHHIRLPRSFHWTAAWLASP